MTAIATLTGEAPGWTWSWEMRSVNARGLDIRLRLPDWLTGLDQAVRAAVTSRVTRGNLTIGLRLQRVEAASEERLDPDALHRVLSNLATVAAEADRAGLSLRARPAPPKSSGFGGFWRRMSARTIPKM